MRGSLYYHFARGSLSFVAFKWSVFGLRVPRRILALRVHIAPCLFGGGRSYFPLLVARYVALPLSVGVGTAACTGNDRAFIRWYVGGTIVTAAWLPLRCHWLRNVGISPVGRRFIFGAEAPSGDVFGGDPALLFDGFPFVFADLSPVVQRAITLGVLGHGRNEKGYCQED